MESAGGQTKANADSVFYYEMKFETLSIDPEAFEGLATSKQIAIHFDENRPELFIEILIYGKIISNSLTGFYQGNLETHRQI